MTSAQRTPVSSTAMQLMLTAERLFAQHGLAGVSLRQIASEAGSANSSAVHYHFGSKEKLVAAIFAHRLPQLAHRQAMLLARLDPQDVRQRLEAHLLPVFELAESQDGSYLSFVEHLLQEQDPEELVVRRLGLDRSVRPFVEDMRLLLTHLEEPVRTMRIDQVSRIGLHVAAARERSVRSRSALVPFGLFVASTIDGLAGYLTGPMSEETRRHVTRAGSGSTKGDQSPSDRRRRAAAPTGRRTV